MEKENKDVSLNKRKRPLWLKVVGSISAPVLVLSVVGILLELSGNEAIVRSTLSIFLALLFVVSVAGILFALLYKKR